MGHLLEGLIKVCIMLPLFKINYLPQKRRVPFQISLKQNKYILHNNNRVKDKQHQIYHFLYTPGLCQYLKKIISQWRNNTILFLIILSTIVCFMINIYVSPRNGRAGLKHFDKRHNFARSLWTGVKDDGVCWSFLIALTIIDIPLIAWWGVATNTIC